MSKIKVKIKQFSVRLNIEPDTHHSIVQYCLKHRLNLRDGCSKLLSIYLERCSDEQFRLTQISAIPDAPTRSTEGTEERSYWLVEENVKTNLRNVVNLFRDQFAFPKNVFGNNSVLYKAFKFSLKDNVLD